MVGGKIMIEQGPPRDVGRAWWVVAGCSISSIFSLMSILVGALPTLAVDIERDTGWSRASILGTIGIVVLAGAVFGPYAGKLVDRHGGRWWIIGSQIGFAFAMTAAVSIGNDRAMFVAGISLAAVLAVGASPVSYMKVLVPWFDAKRGIALGLSAVGVGLSAILLPLITAPLAETYGWRQTLLIYAIAALVVAVPVQWLLVHDYPRQQRTAPTSGDGFMRVFAQTWREHTHFRWIVVMFAVMGAAHAGIVLNMVPMQEDNGMPKALAAGTQSALGVALIFGRVIGGLLLDRFGSPKPLLCGVIPAMLGIAMLGFVENWWLVYLAACLIGLGSGIENDGIPYLVSRYFPQEYFARLSAAIQSFSALALAIGPAIVAATRDATGDYLLACMISTVLLLCVSAIVFILPSYGERAPRAVPA
jgi:MFS family permease